MKNQFIARTIIAIALMSFSLMTNAQNTANIQDSEKESSVDSTNFMTRKYAAPNSNNNATTQNAIGLKKGEGFYFNSMMKNTVIGYGITDNIAVRAGANITFYKRVNFDSDNGNDIKHIVYAKSYYMNTTFTKSLADNFSLGLDANFVRVHNGKERDGSYTSYGLLNAMATFGNQDRNISAIYRYGISKGEMASPAVVIAGQFRLSERFAILVEENFTKQQVSSSSSEETKLNISSLLGIRFIGDNVIVSSYILYQKNYGLSFPTLSVRIPFGNRS